MKKSSMTEKNVKDFLDRGMESVEILFIEIKNHKPHLFEEFKKVVFQDMKPEEIKEFYEQVARREAEMSKS